LDNLFNQILIIRNRAHSKGDSMFNSFHKIIIYISLAIMLALTYCNKKKRLEGFDSERWIEDRNGCDGERVKMRRELLKVKFRMRGLQTSEIEDLLGRPDAIELYKRDQKYYIYYMEPGPDCDNAKLENPLKLYVRFTAVGIANELSLKSG